MHRFHIFFFDDAAAFIASLPERDKAKVLAMIQVMERDFEMAYIRTLRGAIKELKVKQYRLVFCIKENNLFFLDGFIKKTQKTPELVIAKAVRIYTAL